MEAEIDWRLQSNSRWVNRDRSQNSLHAALAATRKDWVLIAEGTEGWNQT